MTAIYDKNQTHTLTPHIDIAILQPTMHYVDSDMCVCVCLERLSACVLIRARGIVAMYLRDDGNCAFYYFTSIAR